MTMTYDLNIYREHLRIQQSCVLAGVYHISKVKAMHTTFVDSSSSVFWKSFFKFTVEIFGLSHGFHHHEWRRNVHSKTKNDSIITKLSVNINITNIGWPQCNRWEILYHSFWQKIGPVLCNYRDVLLVTLTVQVEEKMPSVESQVSS